MRPAQPPATLAQAAAGQTDPAPAPLGQAGLNLPGLDPAGLASAGLVPQGLVPQGLVPQGLVPQGLGPAGLAPAGLAPAETAPADLASAGAVSAPYETPRFADYLDPATGALLPGDQPRWRADHGGPLDLIPGPGLTPAEIRSSERSLWRYSAALRLPLEQAVSLGEGWTPLITRDWEGHPTQFKLEYIAPTGSFKDRGMAVMISYLRSTGLRAILEDSSGNAGASMAAYAAAAGLAARILVPAKAPRGKVVQIAALGAEIELVGGTRQDVADQALREAESRFYASHNWQPYFIEGTKTLAFELWEQSGFDLPEAIIVPLGYGSNVLGLWRGFEELLARGQISRIPRIFAVQAENCAPFAAAARHGPGWEAQFTPQDTIADGIASVRPVRLTAVLAALEASGGGLVTTSEPEIVTALKALLGHGLFVEPTSAAAAAALSQLRRAGTLAPEARAVTVLTGSGLKAGEKIDRLILGAP